MRLLDFFSRLFVKAASLPRGDGDGREHDFRFDIGNVHGKTPDRKMNGCSGKKKATARASGPWRRKTAMKR
jgi:hypothetical protein